jgi:HAE1 family hydrophobic/amphiphilic exporter-1
MGLTRVALTRPVFMLMVILALVVMGLVASTRLNAELFPNVVSPAVTVVTRYPGAAPEDVERLVTKPIEDAIAGLADIDYISASSAEGRSIVQVVFTDRANQDIVAVDVERRVSAARALLPPEVEAPAVLKIDPSQQPVLFLSLAGSRPPTELYRLAKDKIKPRLETISGVGVVDIFGGREREIQVRVDPAKLQAYGLSFDQVAAALARENQGIPAGIVELGGQQTSVRLSGLFQSVEEVAALPLAGGPQGTVFLRNVADVQDTAKRERERVRVNGQPAVALTVTKQAGANEIRTVDGVRAELARLQETLPPGVRLEVISDASRFTRGSLSSVQRTLYEAVVLTALVLLVFLHTLRGTTIILFAIPTSLITTFMFMFFMGFSLNIMSMLGLVLAVAVLVDDSIVVLENIFRHLKLGRPPFEAALEGRSEIGLAAIALTLVDVVIFVPVAFLSGITGQFFRQFGLVLAASVLCSLFVSFTLTPLLASRWLTAASAEATSGPLGRFARAFDRGFGRLAATYSRLLSWALDHRWLPPALGFALLVGSLGLVPLGLVKGEFLPQTDSSFFLVTVELPPGSSLESTDRAAQQVEALLTAMPEVKYALSVVGQGVTGGGVGGSGVLFVDSARFARMSVVLVDPHERKRDIWKIAEDFSARAAQIPGVAVRTTLSGAGGVGQPIQVRLSGEDRRVLAQLADQVADLVRTTPGARDVTNSASVGSPETRLVADRARLADAGLTAQQVGSALRTAIEGTVVTKLRPEGREEVDIRLLATEAAQTDLRALEALPLLAMRDGRPVVVRLGQVAEMRQVAGPATLERRDRAPVITIGAGLANGARLNDVSQPLERKLTELRASGAVPPGYSVRLGGQVEEQAKAFGSLLAALGLSVVLIYMLLAALYESFVMPFATMFALPVAIVGALVGLAITGNTLNLISLIGIVVLMALVGKNGILLVDYTNTLRARGADRRMALLEAGRTRLRPILMTSAALMVALFPLAARLEEGSEIWAGIGVVLIGGMASSTLLSLLVVPCMYTYFDDLQNLLGRLARWRPGRRPQAFAIDEREPAGLGGRR